MSAVGKGIFHTIMCNEDSVADFVPVDMVNDDFLFNCKFNLNFSISQVINLMVAAAWNTANSKSATTVYNCCTGEKAPITWGQLVSLAIEKMRVHPLGEFSFD